ncbi:MAG: condensation domain-containing protein, partial [Pyrinomonadaceae bacterium]
MSRPRRPNLRLSAGKRSLVERLLAAQGHHISPAGRIPRRSENIPVPLSFAQQRLWFLDQWSPGSATYNSGGVLQLAGPLDVCALAQSVSEIVRRHEALRTDFDLVDGLPVQIINPHAPVPLPLSDLSCLPERKRRAQAKRLTAAEARRPFDLSTGPLLRVHLLRLSASEHVCLLLMHHTVSDGWSISVLLRELGALYEAFRAGRPAPLAELPVQYADFALWQRARLDGELLQPALDFWKQRLDPNAAPLELPTDYPRPPVQTFNGALHAFALESDLTGALKKLARAEGATPFMVLLTAFKVLLHRYTGQTDISVGSPVAGRHQLETEPLIGCFVNTLVLRTSLVGDPSFQEILARVRQTSLDAFAHAELPYERLIEELQPQRGLSRNPLFQVMLVLRPSPPTGFGLAGLDVTPQDLDSGTSRFELTLFLTEASDRLLCSLEYNTDLFASSFMARLSAHFACLLKDAVEHPTKRVSELELLTDAEQHALLFEFNDTSPSTPPAPLLACLRTHLHARPDAVALACGDAQLTRA